MNKFIGIEYAHGCSDVPTFIGSELAPAAIKKMFRDKDWTIVEADPFDRDLARRDRFADNFAIQKKIYAATPTEKHILIGGDHSVNFGHFSALADQMPDQDLCLVYIDAHLDIHTPESSQAQASGAPHGTNVRALLGTGDSRLLGLQKKRPALKPMNLFYLGIRSFEPAEWEYVTDNKIFVRGPNKLKTRFGWRRACNEIRKQIAGRPFVLSFDFDAISARAFRDVSVPEPNGISVAAARFFIREFHDAISFEFVEYAPKLHRHEADIVKKLIGIVAR